MINEILLMDGYGLYVWSAFAFTLLSFTSLYLIIKIQYIKEKKIYCKIWNFKFRKSIFC